MPTHYRRTYWAATALLFWAGCFSVFLPATFNPHASAADEMWVYVAGQGIRLFAMSLEDGSLTPRSATSDAEPSFLAIHPNGRYLFGAGKDLSALAIDEGTGGLTFLNQVPSGGGASCHLVVDKRGQFVLSASYGAGSVSTHRIESDGRLGERTALVQHVGSSVNVKRQGGPHAHSINLDAHNRFAFAADLGLDKVLVYRFDEATGALVPADPPAVSVKPGAGPRHFSFHPSGRFAYVINELDSTVTAFQYDAAGRLQEFQTLTTLPDGFEGDNYPAEILVAPNGRFLYGSNRGQDAIVVFSLDPTVGRLTFVEHASTRGKWPRNFRIDPTGRFLLAANQRSNNVVVFRIAEDSGKLTPTGHVVDVPSPACIRFLKPSLRSE